MIKITGVLFLFFLNSFSVFAAEKPVVAKQAMVVSEQRLASQIGVDILRAGGNAVDAAVAVGYALAVVNPCCGNIGGGGFMTIHLTNGQNIFLNFREKAPLAATPNMYLDKQGNVIPDKSTTGYAAVAVPGTVLGLDTALEKYGTMTRAQVMAPAIKLAEQGFVLTAADAKLLIAKATDFKQQINVAKIFLKNGQAYQAGDRLIQADLANTLKQIAITGPDVFYKGPIAQKIVAASQTQGGLLTLKDFADYNVTELKPIQCSYRGYTIISAPPPSSGGVIQCEMLNILEGYPLHDLGYQSPQSVHYIVEAMRYAFADRNEKLGDPVFVNNPVQQLISKTYAKQLRNKIAATPVGVIKNNNLQLHEQTDTTHYSVVDRKGNAVAVTYTLNGFFGARVIAGDTGFFLNDEMDDFTTKPGSTNKFNVVQGTANAIAPGKRPLSSMAPTIVLKNKKLFMVLGSPGGPRIITTNLLTILNVIDYDMNIQQAIDAPRFHHQWLPDVIYTEPDTFSATTLQALTVMGYRFMPQTTWGAEEAILLDGGTLYGANDKRRPAGAAIGY
jgi:gamma-glutamyltranspeptidase/glutathione hydrolase